MRHRGAEVGHFFLADKADGNEFTDDEEEVLMLFASQAAAAIANARTPASSARADLEALVETSPVGVVVFDAHSGQPVSLNREARRIVESLRTPGRPCEQLQEVISVRRADGREVSLSEFPLTQLLGARRDGAGRGGRALGPRRTQRQNADQRHADPCRRGHHHVGGGDPAGPGPARPRLTGCGPSS